MAEQSRDQASRCMDCGTAFCNWGCPLGNYIPEWNELLSRGQWEKAWELLAATNNFPEITGRLCPAPCENSCVLAINDDAVTIRENELAISEYAFSRGLARANPPRERSGKRVAIVGSGPAGLACADCLNQAGHTVVVFEKDDAVGGILRYGIPDFKLEKWVLGRRLKILEEEGISFELSADVGAGCSAAKLRRDFDALCLAGGCSVPRDLGIAGRNLKGVHFAMEYLVQSNQMVAGKKIAADKLISAAGKKVVVIGGGDTGADCVGVAHRQGASCVTQLEILPQPTELKYSSSHEEGGTRQWQVSVRKFCGEAAVKGLSCLRLDYCRDSQGRWQSKEIPGSAFEIEAQLALLAMGFLHPRKEGLLEELRLQIDARGNVAVDSDFMTGQQGVFACGDMRSGQSLVVRAIADGRAAARAIGRHLNNANPPKSRTRFF